MAICLHGRPDPAARLSKRRKPAVLGVGGLSVALRINALVDLEGSEALKKKIAALKTILQ